MTPDTILLAEDNPDDRDLTIRALKRHLPETEIVVAGNGKQVIEYLSGIGAYEGRDTAMLPRVLLLDVKMPLLDGLATLSRIRDMEHTRYLPVVMLTSSDEYYDKFEAYRLGANSFVRKSVKFEEFIEAAEKLGAYWMKLNLPPRRL